MWTIQNISKNEYLFYILSILYIILQDFVDLITNFETNKVINPFSCVLPFIETKKFPLSILESEYSKINKFFGTEVIYHDKLKKVYF